MKPFASYLSVGAIVVAGVAVDRFAFNAPIGTVHALNTPSREARPLDAAGAPVAADDVTINAFNRASPSVVQIINVSIGSGSGVVYDKSGDIVTNFHVVSGGKTFHVRLKSGQTLNATLVGSDSADDLALLHVASASLPVAAFGNSNNLKTGQGVLAIGNPLGLQQTVTNGLVSATGRTVQEPTGAYLPDAIQTSAPINPGNSGGALVALDGTIVGIPTLVAADPQLGSPAEGIGFAISSARVQVVVPQLIKYHRVLHTGRAYLGVTLCSAQTAC
ncbi:MAG: hypothetical protein JWO59_3048, partial [Chloroflexi bacterium]|nr:hypothetical protein [Chloroflexota bacterium]